MYTIIPINEYTYHLSIQGDEYNYYLYNSIRKIINGSHIEDETNSIYFSAEKVIPFKTYIQKQPANRLSHHKCIQMVYDLSKQFMILHKSGYGIYGFDMNDILTIDDHFIFCNTQYMLPIVKDHFVFTMPFKMPYFSSPELFKLTKLPSKVSYKCYYYSLGTFVSYCLLNVDLLVANDIRSSNNIHKMIEPLYNTKIYWFIKRCLNEDINERILLLL